MKHYMKSVAIAIAVFSFAIVFGTVIGIVINLCDIFIGKSADPTVYISLLPLLIGLPFAITEFKNGVAIIRLVKEDNTTGLLKPVIGIANSFINAWFAEIIARSFASVMFEFVNGNTTVDLSTFSFLIGCFVFFALSGLMTNLLKQNFYRPIAIISIVFIVASLIFAPTLGIFVITDLTDGLILIFTFMALAIILAYSIMAIIYYQMYRDEIDKDFENNTDYKVIKRLKNGSEVVKIYQERAKPGSKAVMALYAIALVLYLVFVILTASASLGSVSVLSFSGIGNTLGSMYETFDKLFAISMIMSLPYVVLIFVNLFIHNSSQYYYLTLVPCMSKYYLFMGIFSITLCSTDFLVALAMEDTAGIMAGIKNPANLISLLMILLYIPTLVLFIIGKNNASKLMDSLKNGESFLSDIEHAKRTALFYYIGFSFPVICYVANTLVSGRVLSIGVIPYLLSGLLCVIATFLNKKHNIEESVIAIKKASKTEQQTA